MPATAAEVKAPSFIALRAPLCSGSEDIHFGKEVLRHLGVQQTIAVLQEHHIVPHRIVYAQANEPAKQQVLIDLLDQQTLRTNREEHLQQQSM